MSGQLPEQPLSSASIELAEQITDYNQKCKEFRATYAELRTHTDPKNREKLKGTIETLRKELGELYEEIEGLCTEIILKHPASLELEEQTVNYKQKSKEFQGTSEARYHNSDPPTKAKLKESEDALRRDLEELYREIERLCKETNSEFTLEHPKSYEENIRRCKRRTVILVSLGFTGFLVLLRFFKLLQPLELGFYDHLIHFRWDSKPNDKVLVIEVDDSDIAAQRADNQAVIGSLSNEKLTEILKKADQLKPVAVGLDIYRDNILIDDPQLKQRFAAKDSNLFTVCKSPFTNDEVAPPPDAYSMRVAFSDNVIDSDGIIRRYTLAYDANKNTQASSQSVCTTHFSLALLLASQYLKTQHGIELENLGTNQNESPISNNEYCLKFTDPQKRDVIFPNFQRYLGGYQNVQHYTRCQILINYQRRVLVKYSSENRTNAETITLKDFLSDEFPRERYENRVVLIGSTSTNTVKDYWNTPYTPSSGEAMPGVEIQAQAVSQIINTVLPNSGGRPMIWVLPQWNGIQWGEFFWIWAWSLAGGFLVWWWRFPKGAVIAIAGACASGYIICSLIFQLSGGWFPFIPVVGVLMLTGSTIYWLTWRSAPRELVETLKHNPQS